MHKAFITTIVFLLLPLAAQADTLELLQTRLARQLSAGTVWGLTVQSLETDASQSIGGNETAMAPGSVMKMLLAAAVLEHDFPGWQETQLLSDAEAEQGRINGNLYLHGYGQPLLTVADVQDAVQELSKKGITRISGDIVADATFFQVEEGARTRQGSAYALPGALGLDLHTVRVTVAPTQVGQPPTVEMAPPNAAAKLAISARTIESGRKDISIVQLDDRSYKVSGNIPQNTVPVAKRFALEDAALYAAGALKALLEQAGIEVAGNCKTGKTPNVAVLLHTIEGPPLDQVLRDMNWHSLNLVADNLLLALGAHAFEPPGTFDKGVRAIETTWQSLNLPTGQVSIGDGSGLNRANRITTERMAQFLSQTSKQAWFESFKETLPRAGTDGIAKGLAFKNENFRVKSGRLEDVYALAGYGVTSNDEDVSFCFIVSGPGAGVLPNMEQLGAKVLRAISKETFH